MASTRSTIEIIIEGITRGLTGAAAEAEAATRRVEAAEDNVNRARTRSEDTAARLEQAEQRLEVARATQGASTQRIADQETRINDARTRSQQAAARLGQAENDLDAIRRRGGSTQELAAAEERISRARRDSETAAGSLQNAERRLEDLRRQQGASALRVAQAEDAVRRARRDSEAGSRSLADAEAELVRRRGELDTADRRGSPLRSFFAGIADGINPVRALAGLIGDVTTRMGGFGEALSAVGGPIVQAVLGLVQFAAVLSVIGEVVGLVGGLIGQALGGIPALLLAVGFAAGTVILGLKGIENAAKVLEPAFKRLQASVSAVFQKQLTPVFQELAAVLPQLTRGFDLVALAVSGLIKNLVSVVSSTRGIQQLQSVLAGTAAFVTGLSDGVARFLSGLIAAAAASQTAMSALGTAIGDIFGKVGDVFTKLAANGVIQAAVAGLAATIEGLANVLAPVVSLLIQMGAALGNSLGVALTGIGKTVEQVTPFFVKLADVAGKVLVDAFRQLGPPIAQLIDSILPGAAAGLDGFASLMHNVVLPALAGFINWIRTDGIPGIVAFTQGLISNMAGAASSVLGFVSGMLGSLRDVFVVLAALPGPMQQQFIQAAGSIQGAKLQVDDFKKSIDAIHDKAITVEAKAQGAAAVKNLSDAIHAVTGKLVTTVSNVLGLQENKNLKTAIESVQDWEKRTLSNVFGTPENKGLKTAIESVQDWEKRTLSNVFGTPENKGLAAAIDSVHDTTKKSISNVSGTKENNDLTAAINSVHDKIVSVLANVFGIGAVQSLLSFMNSLHDVTVTITTIVRNVLGFASGGSVAAGQTILVGERGPEILTMPRSGMITNAERSRSMISSAAGKGSGPITVNVMLSQEAIAGIARVEIVDANRSVRRTVLAGSGTTF